MTAYTWPRDSFSQRMEEFMNAASREFRQAVDYTDKVIVPQVRREAGSGIRSLAQHLDRFADVLDPQGKRAQ